MGGVGGWKQTRSKKLKKKSDKKTNDKKTNQCRNSYDSLIKSKKKKTKENKLGER